MLLALAIEEADIGISEEADIVVPPPATRPVDETGAERRCRVTADATAGTQHLSNRALHASPLSKLQELRRHVPGGRRLRLDVLVRWRVGDDPAHAGNSLNVTEPSGIRI